MANDVSLAGINFNTAYHSDKMLKTIVSQKFTLYFLKYLKEKFISLSNIVSNVINHNWIFFMFSNLIFDLIIYTC